jgi:hypothetical protein
MINTEIILSYLTEKAMMMMMMMMMVAVMILY